jgi:hypothetical protein
MTKKETAETGDISVLVTDSLPKSLSIAENALTKKYCVAMRGFEAVGVKLFKELDELFRCLKYLVEGCGRRYSMRQHLVLKLFSN